MLYLINIVVVLSFFMVNFFSYGPWSTSEFCLCPISCELILAATWQNQQNDCAPSEDSDQSGHPPSLIRVFAVRMKKAWVLSYPLSAQRRLWSDWTDAQADLSLRWAHTHFVGFVMSRLICGFRSNFVYALILTRCRFGWLNNIFRSFSTELWPLTDVEISFILNI